MTSTKNEQEKVVGNRYDFLWLIEATDTATNVDPDTGRSREDPETGQGLLSDVSVKRKLRNSMVLQMAGKPGYDLLIQEKAVINTVLESTYRELEIDLQTKKDLDGKKRKAAGKAQGSEIDQECKTLCARYYDVRTFGAVMSTGPNAGQVRGPVQIAWSRSIDPVTQMEHTITRMAVTTEADAEEQGGDNRTMGRKTTVAYGLYLGHGFISPPFAQRCNFTEADLQVFWKAFVRMFDHDHSSMRGGMVLRRLVTFKHDSALGNAPADQLFDRVKVQRVDVTKPPRSYQDYTVTVNTKDLPEGVTVLEYPGNLVTY
jgi:CRISPR-associated protein Csd2